MGGVLMQADSSDAYREETVCHEPNRKPHILLTGKICRKVLHFLVLVRDVSYGEAVKMHSKIVSKLTKKRPFIRRTRTKMYSVRNVRTSVLCILGKMSKLKMQKNK